jgi:hypothetical protein
LRVTCIGDKANCEDGNITNLSCRHTNARAHARTHTPIHGPFTLNQHFRLSVSHAVKWRLRRRLRHERRTHADRSPLYSRWSLHCSLIGKLLLQLTDARGRRANAGREQRAHSVRLAFYMVKVSGSGNHPSYVLGTAARSFRWFYAPAASTRVHAMRQYPRSLHGTGTATGLNN